MYQQDSPAPLNLLETFQKRHSARTFQGQNLTQQQKDFITQSISEANQIDTPFHSPGVNLDITGPGLGRFFMISDEAGWIVLKIPISEEPQQENQTLSIEQKQKIDVAYIGQHLAMKLTQNYIDSVWVAGTYNESEAERRFPGFKVPCSIAYGIESENPHFALKMVKFIGVAPKQGQRLPYDQLFYDNEKKKAITEADLEENRPSYFKDFVTSLRSGPSAGDRQPWRFVLCGKEVHLFDAKMSNFSPFDIGVALANLNFLSEIRGGSYSIEVREPPPESSPLGGTYITTVIYQDSVSLRLPETENDPESIDQTLCILLQRSQELEERSSDLNVSLGIVEELNSEIKLNKANINDLTDQLQKALYFLRQFISCIEGKNFDEIKIEEITEEMIQTLCYAAINSKTIKDIVYEYYPEGNNDPEKIGKFFLDIHNKIQFYEGQSAI